MLLTCKALVEGGRVMGYDAALQVDIAHAMRPTRRSARDADALVGFLTPIVKACLTEWGVECTYHALQCFGGHGYIAEHGMEQLARDARITTLYEGTTGIQALDLLGRKILQLQGEGLKLFLRQVERFCQEHAGHAALADFIPPLREKAAQWQSLTMHIGQRAAANPDEVGAASYDYLMYSGYVVLAYWWARSVAAAEASAQPQSFKDDKRSHRHASTSLASCRARSRMRPRSKAASTRCPNSQPTPDECPGPRIRRFAGPDTQNVTNGV